MLSDSAGGVATGKANTISFRARDFGKQLGHEVLASYFSVHSNDPVDSLDRVTVVRRFVTGIDRVGNIIPLSFELEQNYPNPFNPNMTIKYELPKSCDVRLGVYDLLGREVSVLVNERQDAGVHEVRFNSSSLASRIYLNRLQVGSYVQTRKLVLVR